MIRWKMLLFAKIGQFCVVMGAAEWLRHPQAGYES